jgi:hypothetical protein
MNTRFRRFVTGFILVLSISHSFPLAVDEQGSKDFPWMLETSVWMLANLLPDSPGFYQLCLGYQRFLWEGLFASLYAIPFL